MNKLSLRSRLVIFTLLAVFVAWGATAAVVWNAAHHELHEILAELPPDLRVAVAGEHDELIEEVAAHLLQPLLIALPALALLLWLAVAFALRPLRDMADALATRAPDHLQPLALATTPAEIVPLVTRLNTLFAGIERALDNERRFTADAAHELRTPLAALKAQTQVALAADSAQERDHALQQIDAGCDRAARLVEQLLTIARLDARTLEHTEPVALRVLAEDVLAASAGAAIDRHCDLALQDGDAVIRGDAVLLRSLLRNLIDNAIAHSGAQQIDVAIITQPDSVHIMVRDDGIGIPQDERERVLQRFYRIPGVDFSASTGSGLGLSIVRRIAELHGGSVSIETPSNGKGIVTDVRFPPLFIDTAADAAIAPHQKPD
jgi:two-component system sensor histidine kinase QseC